LFRWALSQKARTRQQNRKRNQKIHPITCKGVFRERPVVLKSNKGPLSKAFSQGPGHPEKQSLARAKQKIFVLVLSKSIRVFPHVKADCESRLPDPISGVVFRVHFPFELPKRPPSLSVPPRGRLGFPCRAPHAEFIRVEGSKHYPSVALMARNPVRPVGEQKKLGMPLDTLPGAGKKIPQDIRLSNLQ
jgi:hypothetical protein